MAKPKSVVPRWLHAVTLTVTLVTIGFLTLLKNRFVIGNLWSPEAHHQRSLDLQFFNGFTDAPIWYGPWSNTLGNTLLFVPLGFFGALLLRRYYRFPAPVTLLLGFGVSLAIETAQYVFALGYSDVDDLLTNSLGALIGALLVHLAGRRRQFAAVAATLTVCSLVLVALLMG